MCASTVGACCSIAVSNPMDVIKTRVQRQVVTSSHKLSAWEMTKMMWKEEGVSSYFKGLTPKIMVSAPKLIFAYTMT